MDKICEIFVNLLCKPTSIHSQKKKKEREEKEEGKEERK
jgi:hypothetical protein